MTKKTNKYRVIGSFQDVDVYVDETGSTYMALAGFGFFWLGVEGDAAEELAKLKGALAATKKRTRAEVDAEIVRVLRKNVTKGEHDDCLTYGDEEFPEAAKLRELCAEETI